MNWLRILLIGGITSYRALFAWLTPWILIPTFIVTPIFQILLFAFLGRSAGFRDDSFFLIGNAILYSAIPCLFAMGNTIGGERQYGTLPLVLVSPAPRLPLFLGRALPVIINGFLVSAVALAGGSALLGVSFRPRVWALITVATAVSAFACTGLGLAAAALALRVRETAVLSNIIFGLLLVFAGVNVPLSSLPAWMVAAAQWVPLTHGIAAARAVANGADFGDVQADLLVEGGIGVLYVAIGFIMLRLFVDESRRRASLETY
jgi:ABC-2 type transport system permease protein